MNLAEHQRILLGLMRSSYQPGAADEPYFHRVANSKDLQEARSNVYLWRVYVLERTCVLTVELLRQRGLLSAALEAFIRQQNISPFREYQPLAFLASLGDHPDPLVAAVSQFELALMKVREGDEAEYVVAWPADPHPIISALAQGGTLEIAPKRERYVTRVSAALPHLFDIEQADTA